MTEQDTPTAPFDASGRRPRHPFWFWLTGFGSGVCFLITFWILPEISLPPLLTVAISLGLGGLVTLVVLRMSGNGATWTDCHRLELAGGPSGLLIALAPMQELDPERLDDTSGMTLVGLGAIVFLT
ncbi:MAG: hypothetical protein WBB22_07055 [Anaerolineae bacterium]